MNSTRADFTCLLKDSSSLDEHHITGIHPDQNTYIPNKLLILHFNELLKPWSKSDVIVFIYAITGFGKRPITYKGPNKKLFEETLDKYEFLVSIKNLAERSGRGRQTIAGIIRSIADPVRPAPSNDRHVYRLAAWGFIHTGHSRG